MLLLLLLWLLLWLLLLLLVILLLLLLLQLFKGGESKVHAGGRPGNNGEATAT